MLKKASRLVKDKEFEKVFKNGRSGYDGLFTVKALANNLSFNRFGIIVSLKVHKKATERNKIKRRVREALKYFDGNLAKKSDIVVICRPSTVNTSLTVIKSSLYNVFRRLKIINDN